jgi:hypothetical protein
MGEEKVTRELKTPSLKSNHQNLDYPATSAQKSAYRKY